METEYSEVAKPDRIPDVVIKPGHAIWWSEMVFMHVYGSVYKIKINQEDGSLYYDDRHGAKTNVGNLPSGTKEAYDKWWYETFESKFLGDENE